MTLDEEVDSIARDVAQLVKKRRTASMRQASNRTRDAVLALIERDAAIWEGEAERDRSTPEVAERHRRYARSVRGLAAVIRELWWGETDELMLGGERAPTDRRCRAARASR